MTKTGTVEKKKRWGGLYLPHQCTSEIIFAVKANANREQSQTCLGYAECSRYSTKLIQLCLSKRRNDLPRHQPIPFASLDFIPLLYITANKVKLSVYPYKRMGVVSTASHSIVSFHGIPLFLFSSLPPFCHPNLTFAPKFT